MYVCMYVCVYIHTKIINDKKVCTFQPHFGLCLFHCNNNKDRTFYGDSGFPFLTQ